MNRRKATLLLSLLTILMVTMGNAIGGKPCMIFAFFMSLGMSFFSWFYDKADESGALKCGRPLSLVNVWQKLPAASRMTPMQVARPATAHMLSVNPSTGDSPLKFFPFTHQRRSESEDWKQ